MTILRILDSSLDFKAEIDDYEELVEKYKRETAKQNEDQVHAEPTPKPPEIDASQSHLPDAQAPVAGTPPPQQ